MGITMIGRTPACRKRCTQLVCLLSLACATASVNAQLPSSVQTTVYARVLKVVPLPRADADCQIADKPAAARGLMAQLRWDFALQCNNAQPAPEAYQVTYTWDGRTYTERLNFHPGRHIPLEVQYR
ncbi:MAG: hypothetical protein ACFHXK_17475 [bacterium]